MLEADADFESINTRKTVDMRVVSSSRVVIHSCLCPTDLLWGSLKQDKLMLQQAAKKAVFPPGIRYSL